MTLLLIIVGVVIVLAVLMSGVGGNTPTNPPIISIVEEPIGSNVDLTVTVILFVILLLGLVLFRTTT